MHSEQMIENCFCFVEILFTFERPANKERLLAFMN